MNEEWYDEEINALVAQHGAVPPPYVAFPDTHPMEICWRMGAGESHMMVFSFWSAKARMNEAQWIEYFRKFPPPPLWLTWMICCVWDLEDEDPGAEEPSLDPFEYDYWVYFRRTAALGFGTEWDCKHAWEEWDDNIDNGEEKEVMQEDGQEEQESEQEKGWEEKGWEEKG